MKKEFKKLQEFLLDNEDFYKINSIMSEPNLFEILGIERDEYRHSNILGWLFNTSESHGLDDFFLRTFLKDLFSKYRNTIDANISFFDIEIYDFDNVEVRREWNHIDLLIVSRQNNLVIVIENKIDSTEHSNQLERYFNIVKKEFNNYNQLFIYLTREGETPSDEDNWLIYSYPSILKLINRILNYRRNSINRIALDFLEQYQTVLRRYIVGNSEIEKICRDIYDKHKKALDLIFQYKPDIDLEIKETLENVLQKHNKLLLDDCTKNYIRFTTKKLENIIPKNGEGWTSSKRIFLFEIVNSEDKLYIKVIIGPGENMIRKRLTEIAKSNKNIYNRGNKKPGKKWYTIHKRDLLNKNNFKDSDTQTILEVANNRLNKFINNNLDKLEEPIKNNWNK